MSPKIDTTLVSQAASGNESAFTRLVNDHYAMVYGLAFSTLKDPSAAADVSQDAFLVAWKNLDRLRSPKAFSMWLRKITRNLSLNWIRSRDYRRALIERQKTHGQPVTTQGAEQEMGIAPPKPKSPHASQSVQSCPTSATPPHAQASASGPINSSTAAPPASPISHSKEASSCPPKKSPC